MYRLSSRSIAKKSILHALSKASAIEILSAKGALKFFLDELVNDGKCREDAQFPEGLDERPSSGCLPLYLTATSYPKASKPMSRLRSAQSVETLMEGAMDFSHIYARNATTETARVGDNPCESSYSLSLSLCRVFTPRSSLKSETS